MPNVTIIIIITSNNKDNNNCNKTTIITRVSSVFAFFDLVCKCIRPFEDKLVAESYINQIKSYVKLLPVVMTNSFPFFLLAARF